MHAQDAAASNPSSSQSSCGQQPGRPLQEFFSAAKRAVLHGTVSEAHPENVAQLANLMGSIGLEELGLDPDVVSDPYLGALKLHLRDSRIKYMRIYEDPSLTFGLFCFPAGAAIPLHNHPGMTVFSRLLFGRLRVSAYDWVVQPPAPLTAGCAPARLVCDTVLQAHSPPLVLFPQSGGNLHEFTAETPCAVLDLLTPPYEPPTRNCTYYRVQRPALGWPAAAAAAVGAAAAGQGQGPGGWPRPRLRQALGHALGLGGAPPAPALGEVVELEVFEPPDSFEVVSGLYPGDPVD